MLIGAYISVEQTVYTRDEDERLVPVTIRERINGPFTDLAQARRIADLAAGFARSARVVFCL